MSHQIIKQPDGRLAIWSTVSDDWIVYDASADQIVDYYIEQAARQAREETQTVLRSILDDKPRDVYFQFAMNFTEAQNLRRRVHGSAPWPPIEKNSY